MHQTGKGNHWFFGIKAHMGLDKDSGLIHSVATSAANVHDLTVAAELLHGEERVIYGAAGYQVLHKQEEMARTGCGVPHGHGAWPAPPTASNPIRRTAALVGGCPVSYQSQSGPSVLCHQTAVLPGMAKNHCKVMVLAIPGSIGVVCQHTALMVV